MEPLLRTTDDRPATGAAAAATDGAAAVDAALGLLEAGLDQLAGIDAAALPEATVTATVRRLARLDGRVDGIQARFVAAAERAGVPQRSGAGSTTGWLKQETGRAGGQAARTSRLARATESAPELTDAVASGDIGPDQADTIASGLDRDELRPDDLAELLPAARRQDPGMFRRQARQLAGRRRQERLRAQELVARDARNHRQWRTADGSLRYEGLLPPAEGDLMEKAIGAFYLPDGKDVPDDQRRSHAQRSADAMTALLGAALRAGEAGDVGGVRPHITLTAPFEAMAPLEDAAAAGLTAVTDCGTVLSMAAFRKLACDAGVRRLLVGPDSQPLDVGRSTRLWPAPIRAAITAVDGGCRGPGCDQAPDRCIIHHVRWWEGGGETSAANGAPLCDRHHDVVHDEGWLLEMDPRTRLCTWTGPDGTVIVTHPRGQAARGQGAVPAVPAAPARSTGPSHRPAARTDTARPPRAGTDPPANQRRGPPPRPDAEALELDL